MLELSMHILDIAENSVRANATAVIVNIVENEETDSLIIEINDNGNGMDQTEITKALDPFYTTKKVRRVGLGLPMLKEACRRCNGMFTIEDHEWPIEPFMEGADMISTVEFASSEGLDVFVSSAGGRNANSGDYVWSNGRLNYSQSGQWGYLRVLSPNDPRIQPLGGAAVGRATAKLDQPEVLKPIPASFK